MKKRTFLYTLLTFTAVLLFYLATAVQGSAAPEAQLTSFPTPTAGPDGRIIYIVQEGDSLWRISAVTGVPLDELRQLNNLAEDAVIAPGQSLLLGLGGPAQAAPTQGPPPTATSELPTPTPGVGVGAVCILLFQDLDGDAIRQEEEPSLPGGAISINDRLGLVSLTAETPVGGISANLFPEPEELGYICFRELEQGDYNVTVAIPDGYNATTILNYGVTLKAGDETYLDFGAQANAETVAEEVTIPEGGEGKSPALAIAGGILLLLGIGLAVFAYFIRK